MVKTIQANYSQSHKFDNGWVYSAKFHHFQKVNNLVYVYITAQGSRWIAQMYLRKETGVCNLEVRTYKGNIVELFNLAEEWLLQYGDNPAAHIENPYYPFATPWQGDEFDAHIAKDVAYAKTPCNRVEGR